MHPFRYAMTRGPQITHAPENDDGFDIEDLDIGADAPDEDDVDEPDDDEPLDEPDEPADDVDDEPAPQARQPSRGENRVAAATRAAKEAREQTARLEQEMAALRQQINNPAPRETQQQINDRLAQMEPWERTEYLRQQDSQRMEQRLAQIQFDAQESADKTAYEALASRRPIAAKLRDDVEARLADMRRNGTTAPREIVLAYLIGQRALANEGRATGRAQKTASANRDRQTARPGNGRTDTSTTRDSSKAARDKRLENFNL